MINPILAKILDNLLEEEFFWGFKLRKRDISLIKKDVTGFQAIEFQSWENFDASRDQLALLIKPLYLKRFDVLHKWFEPFSFKNLVDQRDNYSVGFDGSMLGRKDQFYFFSSEMNFEHDFILFRDELIVNAREVFKSFNNIEKLYNYFIIPVLEKKYDLPNVGADWIFEYLTVTKIVNPNVYTQVKKIILDRVDEMILKKEPNVMEYYPKIGHILKHLESLNL